MGQKGKKKMNKLYSKIAVLSASLALAVGVGVAVGSKGAVKEARAAEYVAYTLDGTAADASEGSTNGYATESLITQDGVTWGVFGNTTMGPWRIGGLKKTNKSDPANTADRTVSSKAAVTSQDVDKVEWTVGAANSLTVNSLNLFVGTAEGLNDVDNISGTFAVNSTIVFEKPSGHSWANRFFTIKVNVTNNTTSNRFIEFNYLTFKYEVSVANPDTITVSGAATLGVGETTTLTSTATAGGSSTGVNQNVVWSSTNERIAKVDSNGVVTGIGNGEVTIKATAADAPTVIGSHTMTINGGKNNNSAYAVMPDDAIYGGYGNNYKEVGGVYMHFLNAYKNNGGIQLKKDEGLVENVGKFSSQITTIELTISSTSNGEGYQVEYSADGESFEAVAVSSTYRDASREIYTIPAGNYFFRLHGGTSGQLIVSEILVGFGNANEAKLVTLATTLDGMLNSECTGEGDITPITASKWAEIKAAYVAGDADAKSALVAVGSSGSYHQVNSFLSRYDHIVGALGLENFLERAVASSSYSPVSSNMDNTGMIIIIAASATSLIGFGLLLIFKKRKVQK